MLSDEVFFQCPYCWEEISMIFERNQAMIGYIEDCEVCCRPIKIDYQPTTGDKADLRVKTLDE